MVRSPGEWGRVGPARSPENAIGEPAILVSLWCTPAYAGASRETPEICLVREAVQGPGTPLVTVNCTRGTVASRKTMSMQDVQQRKGGDTRERMLDAAEASVLEKGFAATSIEELIAAVGITK